MTSEVENLKSTNRILIVGLIIAAFFLGSLTNKVATSEKNGTSDSETAATQQPAAPQQPQATTVSEDVIKALFNDKNIYFGDKNSKNLLVEVADPSCPYCHVAAGHNPELNKQIGDKFTLVSDGGTYAAPVPEMKKLVDEGKAAFVWIYTNGHGAGEVATTALYCAHEQNKFWSVHDLLMSKEGYDFMNSNRLKFNPSESEISNGYKKVTDEDLNNIADFLINAGTDTNQLKTCLLSKQYVNKIAEDMTVASSIGVNGTPGFFVNTTNFAGAYSWKDMESAVK